MAVKQGVTIARWRSEAARKDVITKLNACLESGDWLFRHHSDDRFMGFPKRGGGVLLGCARDCSGSARLSLLVEKGTPSHHLYREIGRALYCLEPRGLEFPRREHFRLWVKVETAPDFTIDLNANVKPYFPDIFAQNCLLAMRSSSQCAGGIGQGIRETSR
eukprot:gene11987-10339_t